MPPENVYHKIHGWICKHHNFEVSDWKVFNGQHNALCHNLQGLDQDIGYSGLVALSFVLDFSFSMVNE